MTGRLPALFCDGMIEAQVVNGVARLTPRLPFLLTPVAADRA